MTALLLPNLILMLALLGELGWLHRTALIIFMINHLAPCSSSFGFPDPTPPVSLGECNPASVELKAAQVEMSTLKKSDKKAALDFAAWSFNVTTSVGLIMVNKALMATYGFSFGMPVLCSSRDLFTIPPTFTFGLYFLRFWLLSAIMLWQCCVFVVRLLDSKYQSDHQICFAND